MMKVQVGEIFMDKVNNQKITYPNKTKKYLLPCLKFYGETFINKLNNVFKVAVGIGDIVTDNCGITHTRHIFILLDSTIASSFFIKFLDWVREQPMYETDYIFDNIQKSDYHMVVLKFPEECSNSFETFKKGMYSQMYDRAIIDSFFHQHPNSQRVFLKDKEYRIFFTRRLNRAFGTTISPDEYEGELDLPPDEKEIFNHHIKKR